MSVPERLKTLAAIVIWLLALTPGLNGQTYRFRNFGPESKIPDTYVYSLNQDLNGFLWVGTGTGVARFDGIDFHRVVFPDSVTGRFVTVTLRDKTGRIWLGCSDGSIFYTLPDGLGRIPDQKLQSVNDIVEDASGNVWIIPQDRMIIKISPDDPATLKKFFVTPRTLVMTAGCILPGGSLVIGTQENLLQCYIDGDTVRVKSTIGGIEYTKVQSIKKLRNRDEWLIGTEGSGLFRLLQLGGKPVISRFQGHPELETLDIKAFLEDNSGNIWMSAYSSGIYRISVKESDRSVTAVKSFTMASGLMGENIRSLFQDMEGNIWIGFYGEGLAMLTSDAFSYFSPSDNPEENNIIFVTSRDQNYLLGTPKGYFIFNPATGKSESFTNLSRDIPGDITCYESGADKSLWMGTKGNGLYTMTNGGNARLFYRSHNTGEDYIRCISLSDKYVWTGTLNGIVVLDRFTGRVIRKLTLEDRLPHNSINQVFLKKDGTMLPAAECDRLYNVDLKKGVTIGKVIMYGGPKNEVMSFAEDSSGGIWAATAGNGLFYINHDSVDRVTTANGLFSNYCYSILLDSHNNLWIGHERGFSRFDLGTGVIKGVSTDFAKGGDCNSSSLCEVDGKILIGTTKGIVIYERGRDRRILQAPINNLTGITINNKSYPVRSSYSLPYKKYTVRVDYVGISMSTPEKVLYRTKVDNLNEDWSALKPDRSVEYPLSDGRFVFHIMSVGEGGLSSAAPLSFTININKPYWRTWWFTLLALITAGGAVTIIVRERDKAQAKIKEYLETELAARTRLVMKQKDEIELQNLEITDSINYAKRIQSSILPDIARLKETFSDAFILFHPRDIVSGDFYWFDKINDEKFIIVCADSTGHGVPGAFMSMIGSTLLQDIISRKGITQPSEILTLLDKQIFSTLNQNVDVGVSNDGMDMVVCEINPKNKMVRFASAMRPVIIVMGGESYYIKGNRCSVGGESVIEKYFDDQEYYLSDGDMIYMFSDGLPDQFGGADGKKMKIARMKRLIEEASKRPMGEQKQIISDFFFEWKGDYEQVDDILLMGIRL